MTNTNMPVERRLLRRCALNDAEAQLEFASLSYLNQIRRAVAETNLQHSKVLMAEELQFLTRLLTVQVYLGHDVLPHPRQDLYERIRQYVVRAVGEYIRKTG